MRFELGTTKEPVVVSATVAELEEEVVCWVGAAFASVSEPLEELFFEVRVVRLLPLLVVDIAAELFRRN